METPNYTLRRGACAGQKAIDRCNILCYCGHHDSRFIKIKKITGTGDYRCCSAAGVTDQKPVKKQLLTAAFLQHLFLA